MNNYTEKVQEDMDAINAEKFVAKVLKQVLQSNRLGYNVSSGKRFA